MKMKTITSTCGKIEAVTVRRTESADAQEIDSLINPATVAVFGRVNVIQLLEKANLAVTLTSARNEVLAHAAFFDYPIGDIVDQAHWEPFLHGNFSTEKCTPLNTLFLHLFVAQSSFAVGSVKEIIRTVFSAVTDLHYICLVSPSVSGLEPALGEIFKPMTCFGEPTPRCLAYVCHRNNYCPALHVRRARVEDCHDITAIFAEQCPHICRAVSSSQGPYFLAELIEAQDEENHAAVCESDGVAAGFISVSSDIDLELLNEGFELGVFDSLYQPSGADLPQPDPQGDLKEDDASCETKASDQQEGTEKDKTEDSEDTELKSDEVLKTANTRDPEPAGPSESPQKPNAFCIQMFAIDKKHEMRSADLLPYIFKLFPDRDFCVILVPQLAPEFPLLQSFVRVVPRPDSLLPEELYIFHRSGLLTGFQVRTAVTADRPAVSAMVERLSLQESLLEDLDVFCQARRDPDGTPAQAFVALVQGEVVGIVIIRNEEDIEYIRSHYSIENFIYFSHHHYEEHGQMGHFAIKPIFQHYTKHFFKEVLRRSHKSCLYYPIHPPDSSQKSSCVHYSLASALSCMVPVRPRRQITYPLEELGINAPSKQITKDQTPYALYHISRKLTMEPKVTINARIVVVGASDTGVSFLEVLTFCPHLKFNNMTLISTHGFPGFYNNDNLGFLSTSHGYDDRDHALLSLRSCVSVVTGKMVGINRTAKYVLVSGNRKVPYDHLILCTGLQYQVPCPTGVNISHPVTNSQLPPQPRRRFTSHVPSNLFTLNERHDCVTAHRWLQDNFVELEGNAIVYGNTVDAYTCVEALLCLGVHGSRIHLVIPPAEGRGSCFSDPTVEKAMERALEKAEVHVHYNCILAQMNGGGHPEPLTSVSFTTDSQPLLLNCGVFINVSSRGVDYDAFKSANDARLVFDGRLVIDATFHTNDPAVRAAGSLTKFSRRYHAERWTHCHFNSKEVGQELAAVLLPFFDPTLEPIASPLPDEDRLTPIYRQAKIQGGRLPGGYSYLHVTKPSIPDPVRGSPFGQQGRDILTGRMETGNYFCLHLNQYETVETITCLSVKPIPVSNYLCLYGKHQELLNHLSSRYNEGLVHDLYSFFTENWCMAIYHDRFADFEMENRQIMQSTKVEDQDSVSMPELIQQVVEDKMDVAKAKLFLKKVFEKSDGLTALKTSAMNYLRYNGYHLPMYAKPGLM